MTPEYRFPLKRNCGFLHIGTMVSNLRNRGVKPPGILNKAYYSLDHDNGIENAVINRPLTPEEILEDKQRREQLYAAVMALPDKQAKRIYARFYLGMTPTEIAKAEGVDVSRVRDSIRRGLKHLAKLF